MTSKAPEYSNVERAAMRRAINDVIERWNATEGMDVLDFVRELNAVAVRALKGRAA